jgi:LacI family fructose operon transcriptional repressor
LLAFYYNSYQQLQCYKNEVIVTNIKDVAEAAGVSTATVSRVLSDKPHVRPELRQRVLAAMDDLDYKPNRVARSLRAKKSSIIGLIVSDIQNPFFTAVGRAVEDVASAQGMSIFLCNSDEDQDKEIMYLEHMRAENVAGVIFSPTRQTADAFSDTVGVNLPMVVIDRRVQASDVDSVLIENVESAYQLTEHLIADGYRRIGAMFGIASTTGRERRKGFVHALREHGLEPEPDLINYVDAREEVGYATTKELLKRPERPEAIFSSNGLLATGAFRALRESQLRIPDEIAFATFDDTPWAGLVEPPVTVIRQPTYEIGKTACELLLERIDEPSRPTRQIILKSALVVRRSCGRHG